MNTALMLFLHKCFFYKKVVRGCADYDILVQKEGEDE